MSNPEIGEAFVKIRPLVGDDFQQQVGAQVDQGLKGAQQAADKLTSALDNAIVAAGRLKDIRAQQAEVERRLSEILTIKGMAQPETFARSFYAEELPALEIRRKELERQVILEGEVARAARARVREQIRASQEGAAVGAGGVPAGGGFLSDLEDLARGSGRRGGISALLGGAGRAGLLGVGAVAGFQAINEISSMLRVAGDEAFTFEGKVRNAGAALLTGNFIGGIKAIAASKPAEIMGDLADEMARVQRVADPLAVSQERLNELYDRGGQAALGAYVNVLLDAGKVNLSTAGAMLVATQNLRDQEAAAKAAAAAVADVADQIARAGSEAAAFGERGTDFGRGVGGVTAESNAVGAGSPVFIAGTGGTDVGNAIRDSITSRIRDDQARLAQQLEDAKLVARQKQTTFDNLKGTRDAAEAYKQLVVANTAVATIQNQIKDAAEAAAKTAQATAQAKAKEAAEAAAQRAADAITARQTALETNIAKAALTKRKSDDKAAFDAAKEYWAALVKSADTALEREKARARLVDLRKREQEALKGETPGSDEAAQLAELRIRNRVDAARLTEGLGDDKRAINQLINYYREQFKAAEGLEKEQARSKLIAARLSLKSLNSTNTQGESPDVFVNRLFTEAADQFRRFGSNISTSASGLLAPQDARGELGSILLGGRQNAAALAQHTRDQQLSEAKKQTALLQIVAHGPTSRFPIQQVPKEVAEDVRMIGSAVLRGL